MKIILLIMIGISVLFGAEVFKDNSTGLIWQDNRDARFVDKNWSAAKIYCRNLTFDSRNDWRLPNIKELQSIVDITKDPSIKDGFKNVASYPYWSSSPNVSDNSEAWKVHFGDGPTNSCDKSDRGYIRCVRGGQQL